MAIELRVPEVGESISEVEIGAWLKNEGDFVERNDEVVVIETDKATVEIPAPESGTITKILKATGQTASVHEVIAYIDADGAKVAKPEPARNESPTDPPASETRDDDRKLTPAAPAKSPVGDGDKEERRVQPAIPQKRSAPRPEDTPEIETESQAVARIEAEDDAAKRGDETVNAPAKSQVVRAMKSPGVIGRQEKKRPEKNDYRAPKKAERPEADEEMVPMSHLRRRIAERLVQAQHTAALLTTFNEIDMSAVIELREKYRESFQKKHGTKLGFMSFFVKAAVDALRLVPEVNAEIREENIVYRKFFDIGVAVGGGKGLVVPVLRRAELLSFAEIESAIADLAQRAEQSKLAPEELQGGTFTISNGGIYGSLLSTPIVNPPQSGILGLHAIQKRPVVREDAVVVRPMMYVALTYDHRIIDGREAVRFLKHIKDSVEDPARLLLGV